MQHEFRIGDGAYEVTIVRTARSAEVTIGDRRYPVRLEHLGEGEHRLDVDGVVHRVWLAVRGDQTFVHVLGRSWTVRSVDDLERAAAGEDRSADTAEAPMPGTVVRVGVQPGDAVRRGQVLVVIESMKMETAIVAWRAGIVERVHYAVGATFDRNAPLITLQSERAG